MNGEINLLSLRWNKEFTITMTICIPPKSKVQTKDAVQKLEKFITKTRVVKCVQKIVKHVKIN